MRDDGSELAGKLDDADTLRDLRERFQIPEGFIYLDGNSLGPVSQGAIQQAEQVLDEWSGRAIDGWNDSGWWRLPIILGDVIGGLLGAAGGQVVVCDNTTVNLYKVLSAAMSMNPGGALVIEATSFPTDRYIASRIAQDLGVELRVVRALSDLGQALDGASVALINHVDFKTGALANMEALTRDIRDAGVLAVWDLSHSAGVVPMELDAWRVDFAVGCTYKYLNGGPGAPAYIYARAAHHDEMVNSIPGWLGHAEPFLMESDFRPASGPRRLMTGTPPIVSMRALAGALEVFSDAGLPEIRAKSMSLTSLFIDLVDRHCRGAEVITPRDPERRGSQVSLRHPAGIEASERVAAAGVRGDFRAPDVLRFGLPPLYLSHHDVVEAVHRIASALSRAEDGAESSRPAWDAPT